VKSLCTKECSMLNIKTYQLIFIHSTKQ
jgi:hypothetical protein